jgi:type IV secretory pathway TrbL component
VGFLYSVDLFAELLAPNGASESVSTAQNALRDAVAAHGLSREARVKDIASNDPPKRSTSSRAHETCGSTATINESRHLRRHCRPHLP